MKIEQLPERVATHVVGHDANGLAVRYFIDAFNTLAEVTAATIPDHATRIYINERKAHYRSSTALEVASYPALASTTSNGGAKYWLIDTEGQTVTPQMLSALGNDSANDTAAVSAWLEIGGGFAPAGTYLIDDIGVDNLVYVRCHPNAVFKRRSAPDATSSTIEFLPGAEGSVWEYGWVDGDRDTHDAAYNDGTAPVWNEFKISCSDVTVRGLKAKDALYNGIHVNGSSDPETPLENVRLFDIYTERCAMNAVTNVKNATIDGFHSVDANNDGHAVFVRGLSINTITGGFVDRVLVERMGGDAATPSSTDTVTGILALDLDDVTIGSLIVRDMIDDIDHLGISIVRAYNCDIDYLECSGFAGNGIELIGIPGTTIKSWFADAKYHKTSFSPVGSSGGMIVHGTDFYPLGTRTRRTKRSRSENAYIGPGIAQRCGIGIIPRASGVTYHKCRAVACVTNGFRHEQTVSTSSFTGAGVQVPRDVTYDDCEALFCGNVGLSLRAGSARVIGGRYANNGITTGGASGDRSGIGYPVNGTIALEKLTIPVPPLLEDTQTGTFADAATFQPGTAAQTWEHNDDFYVYEITLLDPDRFSLGQRLSFRDSGGAGVHQNGTIVDINRDEAVVKFDSAVTLSATGNTAALTGTWTGSGTALTGAGGAANTEVTGAFWVTDGSEWRQVIAVTGANAMTLNAAFTSPLSGATLNKLSIDVHEIQSQQFGGYFQDTDVAAIQAIGWLGSGNVLGLTSLNAATTITGASQLRANRFTSRSFSVADDAAVSYAPSKTGGLLIVNDGVNTGAAVVYRATASPLTTLIAPAAGGTVNVTTGALAGTTGTDAKLTISAHTDGLVYIENRRGSTLTLTVIEVSAD